ncbi:hypothetical protein Nepgr_029399 [Nepenthes gracilis]|uniref:Uncharacterized protein n=1 Tax=Nepenthes gracilis TaxID=150966 RepID=A0AAD3Y5I3_NEPGR|nr:hypothetical protein Nepgr_029399 [Nepenthes gracilis]
MELILTITTLCVCLCLLFTSSASHQADVVGCRDIPALPRKLEVMEDGKMQPASGGMICQHCRSSYMGNYAFKAKPENDDLYTTNPCRRVHENLQLPDIFDPTAAHDLSPSLSDSSVQFCLL